MIKADLTVKKKKIAITIHDIKPNAELNLSKTDRAQGQRPGVTLLQMVGPVHEAFEEYAVPQ